MATNPKRKASFSDRSTQDPHFITVGLSPSDQGLNIPDSFMRKYGRDLQDIVSLKVPTGVSWEVELTRYGDGRTLMKKGWEEFAEHYSIEKFYLLMFKYRGNSQFSVFIFDPSGLEIEYLDETDRDEISTHISEEDYGKNLAALKGKKPLEVEENMEEDVSVEILDDFPQSSSREVTRDREDPHPKRKSALKFHPSITKSKGTSTSVSKTVRDKSRFKSYEKAKAFTCSYPFFISFMQPSFVSDKFYLEIPQEFVRRYLYKKNRRHDFFTLHISGSKKCWEVTMLFPDYKTPKGRIVIGWKNFAQEHGLRVGDVCVFELVPCTKNINVTIYSY